MLTEFQKQWVLDTGEEMNGVVNHVVCQVSKHETTEKHPCPVAEQPVKSPKQKE